MNIWLALEKCIGTATAADGPSGGWSEKAGGDGHLFASDGSNTDDDEDDGDGGGSSDGASGGGSGKESDKEGVGKEERRVAHLNGAPGRGVPGHDGPCAQGRGGMGNDMDNPMVRGMSAYNARRQDVRWNGMGWSVVEEDAIEGKVCAKCGLVLMSAHELSIVMRGAAEECMGNGMGNGVGKGHG
ncbi:unnamed protein product [Closterium sp. Naga37s-1]|nr:unnamed protein product [Closterium sp. Naga37s-1]